MITNNPLRKALQALPGAFLLGRAYYNGGMILTWSGRRQLLYITAAGIVLAGVLGALYVTLFTAPPTCDDGLQNGSELGVDCGGSCALLCPHMARDPVVLWQRAFEVSSGNYTAAAYIKNDNVGAGARTVRYSFQLFDKDNFLIVEREGVADLLPVPAMPIIETNIDTGTRTVARTFFSFSETPIWRHEELRDLSSLSIANQYLDEGGKRLVATLENSGVSDVKNVTVASVLYDKDGVARAASRSVVTVGARSSKQVVFTWPLGVPGAVSANITILPSF